jgi:acetyl-CoA carboxylase carboxyl transferase subunit beta
MNWISNVVPPKIRSFLRRETPENLWVKCPDSGELVFHKDLEHNLHVVPGSNYHMRMPVKQRLDTVFDEARYESIPTPEVPQDPLKFRDVKRYSDRLKEYRTKTGDPDAVRLAAGLIEGIEVVVAVQNFDFLGGSLGMAAGEAIITGMTAAIDRRAPFVMFTASGGARMQEGMFSLMQMPRTTLLVQRLRAARLPYIVVLTNPTTGGVTASYAMLGDIHIAEPGAVIGFAGARVIEQTIRERLPGGFQRAEYLRDHGMVDLVVHRKDMKATLARLCSLFTQKHLGHAEPVKIGPPKSASGPPAAIGQAAAAPGAVAPASPGAAPAVQPRTQGPAPGAATAAQGSSTGSAPLGPAPSVPALTPSGPIVVGQGSVAAPHALPKKAKAGTADAA